jgi:hypothetical protein
MKQVRFIPIATCGLKVREGEGQEESRTVVGTPIVFGVRSVNLTPWSSYREVYEVMEPGCISDQLLRESDVILNLNHNSSVLNVLGRCKNGEGTLKLTKNLRDIGCECDLPKTNAGNDSLELIKRGDITGMSFAFDDDWEDSENGVSYERIEERNDKGKEVWLRHVKKVTALYDVSIVTHPAYEQTSVATREQSDAIDKAIEAQLQREHNDSEGAPVETAEEREAREKTEREANGGETNAEKAAREAREAQEREANGGETNAEKEARELAEREQKEREAVAVMRMRRKRLALQNREIENLNY